MLSASSRADGGPPASGHREFHVVLSLVNMVFILAHMTSAKLLLSKPDSKQVPPAQVTSITCLEESLLFKKQGTKIWLTESEVIEATQLV